MTNTFNTYENYFTTHFAQHNLLKDKKHYIKYACKFAKVLSKDYSLTIASEILEDFLEWAKYVEYQASIDSTIDNSLTGLSYKQFIQKILDIQELYAYPNELYSDNTIFCGEFKTAFEAQMYPLEHIWCVQRMYKNTLKAYQDNGSRFFIIKKTSGNNRYVLAEISKGEIVYHTIKRDILSYEKTRQEFTEYEQSLPQELKSKLYEIAADQTDKINKDSHVKELYNSIMRDVAKIIKEHLSRN